MVARSRSARFALLLPLAVFVLGLFGAELHLVLQPHRYCAVHETLEHAADAAHAVPENGHDDRHVANAASRAASGARIDTSGSGEGHDACCLASLANERAIVFDLERVEVRLQHDAVVAPPRRDAPRAESVPRYRLAPKQSPPAV